MTDEGSSVTLIFYRINPKWWTEPALNLASAVAQMSNLTHCEVRDACAPPSPALEVLTLTAPTPQISIGEDAGINGTMKHVARVFNDDVGVVKCTPQTNSPPALAPFSNSSTLSSDVARERCAGARAPDGAQPAKPLHPARGAARWPSTRCCTTCARSAWASPSSNYAMVRSLVWPRETDHTVFFCAGAQARVPAPLCAPPCPPSPPPRLRCSLRAQSSSRASSRWAGCSTPTATRASATPEMLHRIYAPRAAVSANPCLLRELQQHSPGAARALGAGGNVHRQPLARRSASPSARRSCRRPVLRAARARGAGHAAAPAGGARNVAVSPAALFQPARRRADSPPRGHFQVVSQAVRCPLGMRAAARAPRAARPAAASS